MFVWLVDFCCFHVTTRPYSHDQRRVIAGGVELVRLLIITMSTNDALLKEAESVAATDPKRAEQIYKQILGSASTSISLQPAPRDYSFRSLDVQ